MTTNPSKDSREIISASNFVALLSKAEFGIAIAKHYHIKGSVLLSGETLERNSLIIKDCVFEHTLFINGQFKHDVSITECIFENRLYINDSSCLGQLFISSCEFRSPTELTVECGNIKRLSISIKNTKAVYITRGSFEQLHIGKMYDLEQIKIIGSKSLSGKVMIDGVSAKSIIAMGHWYKDSDLNFTNVKCGSLNVLEGMFEGLLKIYGLSALGTSATLMFHNTNIGKAQFNRIGFSRFTFSFKDSYLSDANFINCRWEGTQFISLFSSESEDYGHNSGIQLKELFRQLRFVYQKQGDSLQESFFYRLEMNRYNDNLEWPKIWKDDFWDKLILHLSNFFTGYGSSFVRPLFWLVTFTYIGFLLLVHFGHYKGLTLVLPWQNSRGVFKSIGEFFYMINPLHKFPEEITDWQVIVDLAMRILSSYFIFALVRASRRFIK